MTLGWEKITYIEHKQQIILKKTSHKLILLKLEISAAVPKTSLRKWKTKSLTIRIYLQYT